MDPDALPNSERPSPAAPTTVTAAALVVRFFLEARLTRMVDTLFLWPRRGKFALGERGAQVRKGILVGQTGSDMGRPFAPIGKQGKPLKQLEGD